MHHMEQKKGYLGDCVYWYISEALVKWVVGNIGKRFNVNLKYPTKTSKNKNVRQSCRSFHHNVTQRTFGTIFMQQVIFIHYGN